MTIWSRCRIWWLTTQKVSDPDLPSFTSTDNTRLRLIAHSPQRRIPVTFTRPPANILRRPRARRGGHAGIDPMTCQPRGRPSVAAPVGELDAFWNDRRAVAAAAGAG